MNSSMLFAILVLATVNVLGSPLPSQSALIGANSNLNGSNFGSKHNASDSKSYGSENKRYKTPVTTRTTTTTTTTEKPKIDEFDYYGDYNGDQPYEEIKVPDPTPKQVLGCPEITIICQQYCENERFYSGYCEDKSCVCYGRMYR